MKNIVLLFQLNEPETMGEIVKAFWTDVWFIASLNVTRIFVSIDTLSPIGE